jgi:hypothetical protein
MIIAPCTGLTCEAKPFLNGIKWDVQHWGFRSLFLKQPALPGKAPQKKQRKKKNLKKKNLL